MLSMTLLSSAELSDHTVKSLLRHGLRAASVTMGMTPAASKLEADGFFFACFLLLAVDRCAVSLRLSISQSFCLTVVPPFLWGSNSAV